MSRIDWRGTTIVCVRKDGKIAIAGDGQVTGGNSYVVKGNARKVRRIYNAQVINGIAGATGDAVHLN